jgi:hypothetical protein
MCKELPFVVECKSFARFYEKIAAFNDKRVADDYAASCAEVNPNFSYRVMFNLNGE